MGDSTTVVLQCISVVDNFIDGYPFGVDVPCGGLCSGIVGRVVKVIPSLQGVDHNRFRLYKPPSSHSIPVSYSLDRFRLTKEHLTDPLLPPYTVKEKFQEKFQENGNDRHLSVDVIICVDSRGQGALFHPLVVLQVPDAFQLEPAALPCTHCLSSQGVTSSHTSHLH